MAAAVVEETPVLGQSTMNSWPTRSARVMRAKACSAALSWPAEPEDALDDLGFEDGGIVRDDVAVAGGRVLDVAVPVLPGTAGSAEPEHAAANSRGITARKRRTGPSWLMPAPLPRAAPGSIPRAARIDTACRVVGHCAPRGRALRAVALPLPPPPCEGEDHVATRGICRVQ